MSPKLACYCFTWLVRISSWVVPIRKSCPTCPVLLYEVLSLVFRIIFLAKEFEWTVNIKINVFTSFHCWYGLQINRFCMTISKPREKHLLHSNCSSVLLATFLLFLLFSLWTCDIMIQHIITAYTNLYFLQNNNLRSVRVFRGVKYCLNTLHRRRIIVELLVYSAGLNLRQKLACAEGI